MLCQWWEGELERGYVVHRARYHLDQYSTLQPQFAALAAFAATLPPVAVHLRPRSCPRPPKVEIISPASEQVQQGSGKRQGPEQGGEAPCEGEKDATLKYVMHDLAPELYVELMAAFR
jgi:hypothetical protein